MNARERRAALDLREALGSALDMQLVLERAYPSLLRLVDADCAALGISVSGRPEDFEWLVADLPRAFFVAYPEMAPHDFVRAAVTRRPNVVLRDQEMIPRPQLEANMIYHRAREVGAPLEQVMAVMLHVGAGSDVAHAPAPAPSAAPARVIPWLWQSGLSVYRDRRRPFLARQRAALQDATPAIANAVRNCRLFGAAAGWEAAMKALLDDRCAAALLVAPSAIEIGRSARAAAIVERWFEPHERRPGHLPSPLAAVLERAARETPPGGAPTWTRRGADSALVVSFLTVPAGCAGRALRVLLLEERPDAAALPATWRALLTPGEREVCAAVLRGWDNRLIAGELGRAEATVKKHLQSIFDKTGVSSRAALIARAAELQRPL